MSFNCTNNKPEPTLYSLFSSFTADAENHAEWQEVLLHRTRANGGVAFSKNVDPRIKLYHRSSFVDIMFNSRFDWRRRGRTSPDLHFYLNNALLFERIGRVYDQMEYSEDAICIHRSRGTDREGYPRGIVDVEQVIPLSLNGTDHIDMYYTTINVYSCVFGEEDHFCCIMKNEHLSAKFMSIFKQFNWIMSR